jgi:hypothetical protein
MPDVAFHASPFDPGPDLSGRPDLGSPPLVTRREPLECELSTRHENRLDEIFSYVLQLELGFTQTI